MDDCDRSDFTVIAHSTIITHTIRVQQNNNERNNNSMTPGEYCRRSSIYAHHSVMYFNKHNLQNGFVASCRWFHHRDFGFYAKV